MNFIKPPVSTIVEITQEDYNILTEAHDFIIELISFMKDNNYDTIYCSDYDGEYDLGRLEDLITIKDNLYHLRYIHRLE